MQSTQRIILTGHTSDQTHARNHWKLKSTCRCKEARCHVSFGVVPCVDGLELNLRYSDLCQECGAAGDGRPYFLCTMMFTGSTCACQPDTYPLPPPASPCLPLPPPTSPLPQALCWPCLNVALRSLCCRDRQADACRAASRARSSAMCGCACQSRCLSMASAVAPVCAISCCWSSAQ